MASSGDYDSNFRRDAVERAKADPETPIRVHAEQIGVSESTLRRWVKRYDEEIGSSDKTSDPDDVHPESDDDPDSSAPAPPGNLPRFTSGFDFSAIGRAAMPSFDPSASLPKIDFEALLPRIDVSAMIPSTGIANLMADYDMTAFKNAVMPAYDMTAFKNAVMPHLDYSSLIPRATLRAIHDAFESLKDLLPPNWPDTMPEDDVLLEILNDDGIPLVWVPRQSVVEELVAAADRAGRLSVLDRRRSLVIEDCRDALDDVTHTRLADQQPLAVKAAEALLDGHDESAQALAVVLTETAVSRALSGNYGRVKQMVLLDLDDTTIHEFRLRAALAPIGTFYTSWFARDQTPPPDALSRHVSVHHAATVHYTRSNALIAVMLMSSVLRALNDYWAEAEPPATDA